MRIAIAAAALMLLGGCAGHVQVQAPVMVTPPASSSTSTAAPVASSDPLAGLKAFTLADLQAASIDAHANGDITSAPCWDFLIKTLPTLPSFTPGSTVGAVLAFQKLRDLDNGIASQNGTLKSLNLACAPLVIDTQTTINRLLAIGGGAAATGGMIVPVQVLPVQ